MKESIGFCTFCDRFRDMDRNSEFSYEGKRALFDYLEQYEEDTGEEIELDIIALCCDYNELSYEDIIDYYSIDIDDEDDEDEKIEAIRDYLEYNTSIVGDVPGGFVFQVF